MRHTQECPVDGSGSQLSKSQLHCMVFESFFAFSRHFRRTSSRRCRAASLAASCSAIRSDHSICSLPYISHSFSALARRAAMHRASSTVWARASHSPLWLSRCAQQASCLPFRSCRQHRSIRTPQGTSTRAASSLLVHAGIGPPPTCRCIFFAPVVDLDQHGCMPRCSAMAKSSSRLPSVASSRRANRSAVMVSLAASGVGVMGLSQHQ